MHICLFKITTGEHCVRESSVGLFYFANSKEEVLGQFLRANAGRLNARINERMKDEELGKLLQSDPGKFGVTIEETTEEEVQRRVLA